VAGFRRAALALIVVFGILAFIVSPLTASQPSCRAAGEDYALACDLIDGAARGSLQGPDDVDAYRLVVLDFRSTVRVQLTEAPNGLRVRLLDWQHRVVTEVLGPAGSEAEAALDEPGVYYVLVDASVSESSTDEQTYGVQVNATYAAPLPRVVLFPTRGDAGATGGPSLPGGVTSLANGRYRLSTPRGGTPELGVGASRGLPLTSEATPNDFTFVGDARFERTVQKAAITVRFRYTPEAGGGGAYVLQVDPFLGQFRLSTSEEGRQETVAPWTAHPAARGGTEPMRIVVRAVGPTITVRLNGEQVVQVDDDQYTNGLIVVGTVTWSEAVNATFDNILVTTPAL
jgi:hypothetical protein